MPTVLGIAGLRDPVHSMHTSLVVYATTANLTVCYNLGGLAGMLYGIQVLSGISMALSYVAEDSMAFCSLDLSIMALREDPIHAPNSLQ